MKLHTFNYNKNYQLESGETLKGFTLAYHTAGKLNKDKDNAVWVCHALTANSNPEEWWPGIIGEGKLFDPEKHFIICVNILGSCYGSTGPLSINLATGKPYYHDFPFTTVRDIVGTLELLRKDLGIEKIHTIIGGSLGGQQALEWSIFSPELIQHLVVLASNAVHSSWGIAFNESQRMAIAADSTWEESSPEAGLDGLKAARSIALLSYRNYETYLHSQKEETEEKVDNFKATSYQHYQGEKLTKRFNAYSYQILSKAMDSHNVGRGRKGIANALSNIKAKSLVLGITSDLLFPVSESKYLAHTIPGAVYEEINSLYGHDGFLIEVPKISVAVNNFYESKIKSPKIALFGLGCVGQGFYELSQVQIPSVSPHKIVVKNADKKRKANPDLLGFNKNNVISDESTNLVVEVIDNSHDAIDIVRGALSVSKNVVTANKKMIVENYAELLKLQEEKQVSLLYEAAICASIPILRTIDDYFSQEPIRSIRGLCNGTSNYILSALFNQGWDYSKALGEAQRLGFAEADPTLDVESYDALSKLIILTLHGFGVLADPKKTFNYGISNISTEDINYAKAHGYKIRQVAQVYKTGYKQISLWVTPQFVSVTDPLYNVENEYNGITVEAEHSGLQFFSGKGAGSYPTGAAVLSDVHASLKGYKYRYEKYKNNKGLTVSDKTKIEIYLRAASVDIFKQIPWKEINHKPGEKFASGKITLADLIHIKPLLEKEKIFLASLPFSPVNDTEELSFTSSIEKEIYI
jgi:homoserine O-acetyltransferase